MPVSTKGRVLRNSTSRASWTGAAPSTRAMATSRRSIDRTPASVATNIKKKTTVNTIATFGACPMPSHSTRSGASAKGGTPIAART